MQQIDERNQTAEGDYDIIARGGQIIDGLVTSRYAADVAVKDGRIARVGDLGEATAARVVDAQGLYVVPGFIDMHCHSERGLPYPELAASIHHLTQGVTTVVGGADGYGAWPLHEMVEDQIDLLTKQGIGTNAVLLVGPGQVRRQAMGTEARAPTADELAHMRRLVREAMAGGAHGLSSGLTFLPGSYAETNEVIELAREVAPYEGIYHTHMRDEADGLIEAVREAIQIAEQSGAVAS